MRTIQSLGKTLRIISQASLALLPIFSFGFWFFIDQMPLSIRRFVPGLPLNSHFNFFSKALASVIAMIPIVFLVIALLKAIKLFRSFEKCEIFTINNIKIIKHISAYLLAFVLLDLATTPILSLALTFQYPVGQREILLGFGTYHIAWLAFCGLICLVARIMQLGFNLEEEKKYTI